MSNFVNAVSRIISAVSSGVGTWIASERDLLFSFGVSLVILALLWVAFQIHVVQRRLPIILSLLVTFGATFLFVAALRAPRPLAPAVTPVESASTPPLTVSAGVPTARPVATATATPVSAFATSLDYVGKAANPSLSTLENDLFLPLVEFLALVLGAYVAGRLVQICLFRGPQLVVGGLADASGGDLAAQLGGLSQLFRETVAKELLRAPAEIHKHRAVAAVDAEQQSYPVPSGTTDRALNDLVSDLKGMGPAQVQSVVALIPALFPPRGTNVIGILGCAVPDSSRVRISLWISELSDDCDVDHIVIEEPSATGKTPSAERYQALFDVAGRLLALTLARRALSRHVPWHHWRQPQKYRAEIANIFGTEYLASGICSIIKGSS